MIINKYGILLESLTPQTAEIVRVWRNSPDISQFMDFREYISEEQQQAWLAKIKDAKQSYYFLIRKNELPLGLIHLDSIDFTNKTANVGLFVGNQNFHGTGVAFAASVAFLDFAFLTLGLNTVIAKVNNANKQAIEYNLFLGFTNHKPFNKDFTLWKLTDKVFEVKKPLVLKFLGVDSV